MQKLYDIAIVGGGFIALSLVNALKHTPLSIAVIEPNLQADHIQDDLDGRTFALSAVSKCFFETIGCWPEDAELSKIHSLQVSQQGWFSCSRFTASKAKVDALGYLVPAQHLIHSLTEEARSHPDLTLFVPYACEHIDYSDDFAELKLASDQGTDRIRTRLVVAADGARSLVRKDADIGAYRHDYEQSAIVANFKLSKDHEHIAYERFTKSGPMAVLPLPNNRAAMVWTAPPDIITSLLSLSDDDFIERFQQSFGYRLGKIEALGRRFSYPLHLVVADTVVKPRLAIIGNAAQSLHPVAGQGLNLGLRDVAILAETIHDASNRGEEFANVKVLQRFAENRQAQQQRIIRMTDALAKWFRPNSFLLPVVRDVGLGLLNVFGPIRSRFLRVAMGLEDKLPRLMCGISLKSE